MQTWGIIVAAGKSSRYGKPKQLEDLAGKCVLDHSVQTLKLVSDGVVVVTDLAWTPPTNVLVVPGAGSRSASVKCGLAVVPETATHVLVHDGARPLVSVELCESVLAALRSGAPAVVPAIELDDTIRHVTQGSQNRADFRRVQTPQGFDLAILKAAYETDSSATDDATLVEAAGNSITMVPGDRRNLKITYPQDLVLARGLING